MKKLNKQFNFKQFAKDIIAKREAENLAFPAAVKQIGLSSVSILHRAELGEGVSIGSLPLICNWLEKPVQNYF